MAAPSNPVSTAYTSSVAATGVYDHLKLHNPSFRALVDHTILSPVLTGTLLLLLFIQQHHWPSFKLQPHWSDRLSSWHPSKLRAATVSKTLKVLFALGLVMHVNRFLNRLALNHWHLRKQGAPWEFQTEGNETIVVTGGCSGFGKAMIEMFAARTKANLVVLDIQELPVEMKDIPRLHYFQTDLTSPNSITSTITRLLRQIHPAPTVLINNAGIAQAHTILDTSDAWIEKLFRVNVFAHFTLIRLLLPHMLAMRKGHVVSIASMSSFTGVAGLADYSASKAAVLGLHEALGQELAHRYDGNDNNGDVESTIRSDGVDAGTNLRSGGVDVDPYSRSDDDSSDRIRAFPTGTNTNTDAANTSGPSAGNPIPPSRVGGGGGGHTIQTSIIHPMWARTPLIASWSSALLSSNQPVLTPEIVARRVVDQVLAGRSGSVYIPARMWTGTLLRVVPDWVAAWVRDGVQSATLTKRY